MIDQKMGKKLNPSMFQAHVNNINWRSESLSFQRV